MVYAGTLGDEYIVENSGDEAAQGQDIADDDYAADEDDYGVSLLCD